MIHLEALHATCERQLTIGLDEHVDVRPLMETCTILNRSRSAAVIVASR
jgi:hypothetical protein